MLFIGQQRFCKSLKLIQLNTEQETDFISNEAVPWF